MSNISCEVEDCRHNTEGKCGDPESVWIKDKDGLIEVDCGYDPDTPRQNGDVN